MSKNNYLFVFLLVMFLSVTLICFSSCGLPNANFFDDLNPVTALKIDDYSKGNYMDIIFISNNSEMNFTGFNFYIAKTDGLSESTFKSKCKKHIIYENGLYRRDTDIEDEFIIKNRESNIPTVKGEDVLKYYNENIVTGGTYYKELESLSDVTDACEEGGEKLEIGQKNSSDNVCTYKLRPFKYKFRVEKLPDGTSLDPRNDYYVIVTAYDGTTFIESNLSNVVKTSDY